MSDLDSFFNKKDKKKGGKKKFTTANTDTLAKNLEKQELKEAKAEEKHVPLATSEANKAQAALASQNENAVEDEWKDYDEEKKDYSNLKIEALKVESENEEDKDEEEHEINEDGEKVPKREGGPWNKGKSEDGILGGWNAVEQKWNVTNNVPIAASTTAKSEEDQDIEELRRREKERAKAELESSIGAPKGSVVGGSYVPPHMRGGAGAGTPRENSGSGNLAPMRGGPRRSKYVPDMNSEINFPSLGGETASGGTPSGKHERDFEEVRGSGSSQHHSSRSSDAPQLALGNKFAALRN